MTALWFDELPANWKTRRIKTISPVMRGASPRPIDDPVYFDEAGKFAWVRIVDVTSSNGLLQETTQRLSTLGASKSVKLEPGELFLSIAGSVGKPCVTGIKACIHDGFVYFPFLPKGSQRFIYWIFEGRECFSGLGKLGTQLNLNTETVGNISIPFPPLETQKAIGDFLDREIARIDQLIAKKQRIIELFHQKLESLVHEGIIASSTENIRFGFAATRVSRPVDLKSGASFVRLGLYNRGRGAFKKLEADEEDMGDSSFFWVEPGDLILSGQFAWEGAVALASAGEAGCVVSHRYPVYSGTKRATTAYLLAFFRTKMGDFILNEASRGSAGRNRPLNVNRLEKEKIPIPSATLQARIAEIVSLEMEIRRKIQTSIDLLQEHRSTVITAAVTGQIDVATWGKRGTSDRRLDAIEADMAVAAHLERRQLRA